MNVRKIIIATSIIHEGNWKEILHAFQTNNIPSEEEAERICSKMKCQAITLFDREYPSYLRECFEPPFVLFYYGDISLIKDNSNNIAVVGTRNPTSIGVENTRNIVRGLLSKYCVVSGLATGIDRVAHEIAIENGGKTIAVLGSGIDVCYPSSNQDIYDEIKKHHLLISEYYHDVPPNQDHFPQRNRLISAFSCSTLVTEAGIRSGTSITVCYTINSGKSVFCVPSSDLENSLCNDLIREGAWLVRNADDILYPLDKSSYAKLNN